MTDIVERLRYEANTARENHPETFCVREDTADEAADEIERLREQQKLLIGIFRVNMMRWAEGYSDEDFDTKIAHILGEKNNDEND